MKAERASKGNLRRGGTRVGETKLTEPVTLFAQIEAEQHEALRSIAFDERRSIADIVRAALREYLERRGVGRPAAVVAGGEAGGSR
jgi:hypothetical protein